MKIFLSRTLGVVSAWWLTGVAAAAQPVSTVPLEPVPPVAAQPGEACPAQSDCIAALTPVVLKIGTLLGSRVSTSGEMFPLTLAEPLVVDGRVVVPAGTPGMGEVVHAKKTGLGVGGELVLAARYLDFAGQRIRLRSMQVGGKGKDNQTLSYAVGATVGLPALFIRGKHIEVPPGTLAEAKVAARFVIPRPAQETPAPQAAPTPSTSEGKTDGP